MHEGGFNWRGVPCHAAVQTQEVHRSVAELADAGREGICCSVLGGAGSDVPDPGDAKKQAKLIIIIITSPLIVIIIFIIIVTIILLSIVVGVITIIIDIQMTMTRKQSPNRLLNC